MEEYLLCMDGERDEQLSSYLSIETSLFVTIANFFITIGAKILFDVYIFLV